MTTILKKAEYVSYKDNSFTVDPLNTQSYIRGHPYSRLHDNDFVFTVDITHSADGLRIHDNNFVFITSVVDITHSADGLIVTTDSGTKYLIHSFSTNFMRFLVESGQTEHYPTLKNWTIKSTDSGNKLKGVRYDANNYSHIYHVKGQIVSQYENLVMLSNGELYVLV